MTNTDGQAPKILDIPIGLTATGMRREFDSLGDVEVPANRYWGAQTQRSLEHFNIGHDRMPKEIYHAYGYVKKAAAVVNTAAGRLPAWKGQLIERVCDEVISRKMDEDFPLYVWQTGSGTQSNMNVNEVISNRCIQLVGGTLGSQQPVHPNDHVNMGQSSNDTFPTAMHIAAYTMATGKTIPALKRLRDAIETNSKKWADVVKIGRTHLEDATPLTVGQEWSGYAGALDDAIEEVEHATAGLLKVAMGGTAVGTGLNAPPGFGEQVAAQIAQMTGAAFVTAPNKFTAQGTLDRMMRAHAGLKAAAVTLVQDRQRSALAGFWPAHRDPRADLPGQRARVLDHARQGQPDPGRGHADGRHPGHRLGCGGDHGRRGGELRAERLPSDPDLQLPALRTDHGRHVRSPPQVHGRAAPS